MKRLFGAGALLLATILSACASYDDDVASDSSEISSGNNWVLPNEVLLAGARANMPYDGAPRWTGPSACAKALREGTRDFGEFLRDRFPQVSSIGGYACRKNTASTSRMSVHGTGRALDVFIPKRGKSADSVNGDEVANWLVMNATKIGVQLVIWNRTIWQANGKNDRRYSGPHPHDDHIHVEITDEAARMETPWFADKDSEEDETTMDAGVDAPVDASTDAKTKDSGAGTTKDSGATPPPPPPPPPPSKDAGAPPPDEEEKDETPPPNRPAPDEDEDEADDDSEPSGGRDPSPEPIPEGEPGEEDSLGASSSSSRSSSKKDALDEDTANGGCAAAPAKAADAAPIFLGAAIATILVSRRRRRRS